MILFSNFKFSDRISRILKRLRRILARKHDPSSPSVSTVSDWDDENRTSVEVYETPPKTEFEPVERQRHFGILHYTVNNRFRKMMLIGVINVFLLLLFFLLMFLFVVKRGNEGSGPVSTTVIHGIRTTAKPVDPPICTNNFTLLNDKCLKLNTTSFSKPTAQTICNQLGATLLKVNSSQENQEIVRFLKGANVWLGIVCDDVESCHWDGGQLLGYSNFSKGSPNTDGKCVMLMGSGEWKSVACNEQLPFVCQLPTTSADNCTFNYNHHCYLQFNSISTFSEAESKCEESCGTLPSVHSHEENLFLTSIYKFSNQNLFLGGFASSRNSIFWIDNSPSDFSNFASFDTHSTCIISELGNGGLWSTVDCSQTTPSFICKRKTGIKC